MIQKLSQAVGTGYFKTQSWKQKFIPILNLITAGGGMAYC
jgi:hypothetical protein